MRDIVSPLDGFLSPFGQRRPVFSPLSLFASGEEGAWYEPSTTTCFTDASGTVAATYGDAVQYLEDLSGNGNHATQGTLASRPILARVPEGGRRNELDATDTLATQSVTVTAAERTLSFKGTGTVTLTGASTAGPLVGTGASDRVTLTFTPSAGSLTLTVLGTVTDAQLELGSTATNYQSVASEYDITEAGVTSLDYLSFDGSDDDLIIFDSAASTPWDAFSDAIMLAVANNSSSITGAAVAQWTPAKTIFSHRADTSVTSNYGVPLAYGYVNSEIRAGFSENTSSADESLDTSTYNPSANTNYVQMVTVNGDAVEIRANGSSVATGTLVVASDSRAANNGLRDVRIGARTTNAGGPTNRFVGAIYGLIYRNAVPTTAEISSTEAYLAAKSGVTL